MLLTGTLNTAGNWSREDSALREAEPRGGESEERNLLTREKLQHTLDCVKSQLSAFLDFDDSKTGAVVCDNYDWLSGYSMLEFLRDVGKHFSVNYMTAKDSVKSRLDAGISYTEFSYMLLQAADFMHLNKSHGCTLQVGGSDQWGNITAGIELTRRVNRKQVYGMTFPLITTASGQKLGKTERGAVWLDARRTSPFHLYQYFVRADDRDVISYLNYFTFLEHGTIDELRAAHEASHQPAGKEKTPIKFYILCFYVCGERRDETTKPIVCQASLFYQGVIAQKIHRKQKQSTTTEAKHKVT